ncbi:MAG: TlpA family protein disulfide reductase [Neisseriaceae bacterium]|nr:TlpA family protein disulfide reductase [Neisseriaceae bacterium]
MKKTLITLTLIAILTACKPAAPSFRLPEIETAQMMDERNFIGKTTVLNFWYPSCPGCVKEMPQLINLHNQYANNPNFQTIAISLNLNSEAEVKAYIQQYKLPFAVAYYKDKKAQSAYNVTLAPMTFLVDKNGKIAKQYLGEPEWNELQNEIERLLK